MVFIYILLYVVGVKLNLGVVFWLLWWIGLFVDFIFAAAYVDRR